MRSKRLLVVLVVAAAALNLPSTASGGSQLPNPDTWLIGVPRTIGGVSLGDGLHDANEAWGGGGTCHGDQRCSWGGNPGLNYGAVIRAKSGIVDEFFIAYAPGFGSESRLDELARLRTVDGIGLTTRMAKVKKAYPEAKAARRPVNRRVQAWLIQGREGTMIFSRGFGIGRDEVGAITVTAHSG